jgi:putative DNA primase/helicase
VTVVVFHLVALLAGVATITSRQEVTTILTELTRPASCITNEVQQIALDYLAAGVSIVPIRLDGSKASAIPWKEYQTRRATPAEVMRWFAMPHGIGIVTGRVSGGLEVIDFDQSELFMPWQSMVAEIVNRLPIVETASGGWHVLYRCSRIFANTKLASWEPADAPSFERSGSRRGCHGMAVKATRVETRGEGGYIVGVGSPAAVHKTRNPYVQVAGPVIPDIPRITPDERARLWKAAASFDCGRPVSQKVQTIKRELLARHYEHDRPEGEITPWDDFDRRARWDEILTPHGWAQVSESSWRRPGKSSGTSATVGRNGDGIEVLTVFSSNAGPLSGAGGRTCWGPFRAFTELNYGGDGREAAKAVRGLGFGGKGGR